MTQYKYLLFDADNTLFDFTKAEYLSFYDTCSACGISYSDELYKTYSHINDKLWKKLEKHEITLELLKIERFRELLAEYVKGYANENLTEKAAHMKAVYMDSLSTRTYLLDGAFDICKKLYERYDLYIVTNGIGSIQRPRLAKSDINQYFKGMFISEEIGYAKPASEYFDFVTDNLGGNKSDYLVIGDSLTSDCAGAVSYGFDICWFNPHGKSANGMKLTYTVKRLCELEPLLL